MSIYHPSRSPPPVQNYLHKVLKELVGKGEHLHYLKHSIYFHKIARQYNFFGDKYQKKLDISMNVIEYYNLLQSQTKIHHSSCNRKCEKLPSDIHEQGPSFHIKIYKWGCLDLFYNFVLPPPPPKVKISSTPSNIFNDHDHPHP